MTMTRGQRVLNFRLILLVLSFLTLTSALTEEECAKVCKVCLEKKNGHAETELCQLLHRQCDCGPVTLITKISWYVQAILSGTLGLLVLALCCILFIAVCCNDDAPPGRGLRRFQRGQGPGGRNGQNDAEVEVVNNEDQIGIVSGELNYSPGGNSPRRQVNNNLSEPPSYSSICRPVQTSSPLPNLHVPVITEDDSGTTISTKPPSYDEALHNES